jgi:hypothetical protein
VRDDYDHQLGDPAEERLAAALNHRAMGTCPVASGAAPGNAVKSLVNVTPESDGLMVKPQALQNRIMRH